MHPVYIGQKFELFNKPKKFLFTYKYDQNEYFIFLFSHSPTHTINYKEKLLIGS